MSDTSPSHSSTSQDVSTSGIQDSPRPNVSNAPSTEILPVCTSTSANGMRVLTEMFPDLDDKAISDSLEASKNDVEEAINCLLGNGVSGQSTASFSSLLHGDNLFAFCKKLSRLISCSRRKVSVADPG